MAHLLRMPAVLAGATEAVLLSWNVKPGDAFAAGDALAEIETDKALVEMEAEEAGTMGRLVAVDGQKVSVGDPIAVLVADGDSEADIDAVLTTVGDIAEPVSHIAQVTEPAPAAAPVSPVETSRLFVSPLVRRLARERGIDPSMISGTGPGGRIVRRDLIAWLDSAPSTTPATAPPLRVAASPTDVGAGFEDVPHTGMRRAIARRLTESKSTVPHFYLVADLRVDRLLDLRTEINASPDIRVSVNDLLIKAVAAAYREVPAANVIWTDNALRHFDLIDISVAVSTEKGLVTPVVRNAGSLSLIQLSATVADLVDRARAGRLQQHELEGGTFSISNLGMFGTREFSAILNPPQSGILAVGAARDEVVATGGEVAVEKVMTVTMSVDHRAVDGALAAQWLAAFTAIVENPVRMLM